MILVTRLNGEQLYLNAFQVEAVDASPDTRITLMSGRQIYVSETPDDIRGAMLAWFRLAHFGPTSAAPGKES
jgi:flagellar protein FlbD